MALPRPILLALVGLVLAVGAYVATSSSRSAVDDVPVTENVQPAPGSDVEAPAGANKNDSVAVEPQGTAKGGGAEKEANLREANAKGDGGKADAKADEKPAPDAKKQETRADAKPERDRAERDRAGRDRAERVRNAPAPTGPAARVDRALRQNAVVVMFFRQRGADDDATADAVASVRGRKGVGVMSLPIGKAPRYTVALGGTTVTRAPSVVVLARKRRPVLFEGYIDSASLAQAVADAR